MTTSLELVLWALRDDTALGAAEWRVAVALLSFANEQGEARPSVRRIAQRVGTSPGAVRRALTSLEAQQGAVRLVVERGRKSESGDPEAHCYRFIIATAAVYLLPPQPVSPVVEGVKLRRRAGSSALARARDQRSRRGSA